MTAAGRPGPGSGPPSAQPLRPGQAAGPVVGPPSPSDGQRGTDYIWRGGTQLPAQHGLGPSAPPRAAGPPCTQLWPDPVGARAVGLNSSSRMGAAAPVRGLRANRPARQLQGHTPGPSRREPYAHWRQARRGTSARPLCRSAAWDRGSPLPRPLPLSSCADAVFLRAVSLHIENRPLLCLQLPARPSAHPQPQAGPTFPHTTDSAPHITPRNYPQVPDAPHYCPPDPFYTPRC